MTVRLSTTLATATHAAARAAICPRLHVGVEASIHGPAGIVRLIAGEHATNADGSGCSRWTPRGLKLGSDLWLALVR